ncbi:hypothetical protein B0O99DRAFT_703079 [Bisporella sp. PMI_857]|nr:hypothetical protein B0O99DRAFT_703079 [Bisporella sp. PMI_857]
MHITSGISSVRKIQVWPNELSRLRLVSKRISAVAASARYQDILVTPAILSLEEFLSPGVSLQTVRKDIMAHAKLIRIRDDPRDWRILADFISGCTRIQKIIWNFPEIGISGSFSVSDSRLVWNIAPHRPIHGHFEPDQVSQLEYENYFATMRLLQAKDVEIHERWEVDDYSYRAIDPAPLHRQLIKGGLSALKNLRIPYLIHEFDVECLAKLHTLQTLGFRTWRATAPAYVVTPNMILQPLLRIQSLCSQLECLSIGLDVGDCNISAVLDNLVEFGSLQELRLVIARENKIYDPSLLELDVSNFKLKRAQRNLTFETLAVRLIPYGISGPFRYRYLAEDKRERIKEWGLEFFE